MSIVKQYFIIWFIIVGYCSCSANVELKKYPTIYDEANLNAFIKYTPYKSSSFLEKQLDSILKNVVNDSLIFRKTASYLCTPLADPNSSYRNSTLYKRILKWELASKWYRYSEITRIKKNLFLLEQNNIGSKANDFEFITPKNERKRLYEVASDYTLLLFYNPECEACKFMKGSILSSPVIRSKIEKGLLKIVAIYTDKAIKVWKTHLSEFPKTWIHGRDQNDYLYQNQVYDLKAIPTIYLLDKSKKVVLKDCLSIQTIENSLH